MGRTMECDNTESITRRQYKNHNAGRPIRVGLVILRLDMSCVYLSVVCNLMRQIIIVLQFLVPICCFGQTKFECDSLTKLLEKVSADDQKYRQNEWDSTLQKYGINSKEFIELIKKMNQQDSINMSIVSNIIDKYGWLGKEQISEEASEALFLVIQHAPLSSQLKYLPILKEAVGSKKAKATDYALLVDRTNMYQGKLQIYGSQLNYDANGNLRIFPIVDEPNLDKRRKAIGLPPIQVYLDLFNKGLVYHLPKSDNYKNKIIIRGTLKDSVSNLPIANVEIYSLSNKFLGKTDSSGFYQVLLPNSNSNLVLLFRKNGFRIIREEIPKNHKEVIQLDLILAKK